MARFSFRWRSASSVGLYCPTLKISALQISGGDKLKLLRNPRWTVPAGQSLALAASARSRLFQTCLIQSPAFHPAAAIFPAYRGFRLRVFLWTPFPAAFVLGYLCLYRRFQRPPGRPDGAAEFWQ